MNGDDILVLVRLARGSRPWTYRAIAAEVGMDTAALHRGVARLQEAKLLDEARQPNRANLEEFLLSGVRFVFPAEPGPIGRGIPTAWGAEPLCASLAPSEELAPVWPDPKGIARGPQVAPISKRVPGLAKTDPKLREWFALVDAIRLGRARDRQIASRELSERIWEAAP